MALLTRKTDYSIRAIVFMAKHEGEIVPVSRLVDELKIPKPFLRKILQLLNKKGFLVSHKGKGGGFELSLAADKIFLVDLIKAFQGPLTLNKCLFKKTLCPKRNVCRLKKRLDRIERHVLNDLERITVNDLLD